MELKDENQLFDRKIDVCFGHGGKNNDGVLESSDALALAARIIAYLGEPFGSPKAQVLLESLEIFCQHVSKAMDSNLDGQITPLEWRNGLKRAFAGNENDVEAWQEYYTSSDPNAAGNWLYGDIWADQIWEGSKVRL